MNLTRVQSALINRAPKLDTKTQKARSAAVALILHQSPSGLEALFIERAQRPGDPWSGQMALPGGKHDPEDRDLAHTAQRETQEEVGLSLDAPFARLDELVTGKHAKRLVRVSPFAFRIDHKPELQPNEEVATAVWIPLEPLLSAEAQTDFWFERDEIRRFFPAVQFERFVIWGLTYRLLREFYAILGHDFGRPAY